MLNEIKNNYITGERSGKTWCSMPKRNFDWLIETIERQQKEIEYLKEPQINLTHTIGKLQKEINSLKYEIKKKQPHDPYGYEAYWIKNPFHRGFR